MNLSIYSYTATICVFTGLAMLLYLAVRFISPKNARLSATDRTCVLLTILIALIGTGPGEWAALASRAWTYSPAQTLHTIFFGAELETYLFTILVSLVVSIATLLYARREDRKRGLG